MKLYSDAFLNDSYLKYVGWTMHDKVGHMFSLSLHDPNLLFIRSMFVCLPVCLTTVDTITVQLSLLKESDSREFPAL